MTIGHLREQSITTEIGKPLRAEDTVSNAAAVVSIGEVSRSCVDFCVSSSFSSRFGLISQVGTTHPHLREPST